MNNDASFIRKNYKEHFFQFWDSIFDAVDFVNVDHLTLFLLSNK